MRRTTGDRRARALEGRSRNGCYLWNDVRPLRLLVGQQPNANLYFVTFDQLLADWDRLQHDLESLRLGGCAEDVA
jgi:hypothetical protein